MSPNNDKVAAWRFFHAHTESVDFVNIFGL